MLADFNTDVANPGLTIGGDVAIYGYVAHKAGSDSKWTDGWTMDFGSDLYQVDFSWTRLSDVFNGVLSVGSTDYALADVANSALDLGQVTGSVTFHLDPVAGGYDGAERGSWILEATEIVPAPLPAGGVALMTGLAAFAAMRRKTK